MKIVVIGGSGLIGSGVVANLRALGHEVVAASPSTGVNTLTGQGLGEALAGAQVVVDVSNSPSFEDKAVMDFFRTSTGNVLAAAQAAKVGHVVILSVVGTDRLQQSGYFRAKQVQEDMVKASPVPFTIVRATQFFEFIGAIADAGAGQQAVRVPARLFQPIAARDVSRLVAEFALRAPVQGMVEIGGPQALRMDAAVAMLLRARGDARSVEGAADALYFGTAIDDASLVAAVDATRGATSLERWLAA